jgi:hypothetical protein
MFWTGKSKEYFNELNVTHYFKMSFNSFKKGIYLAQAIQMCFFFGLIIVIASTIRHRIWMKESGNITVSAYLL